MFDFETHRGLAEITAIHMEMHRRTLPDDPACRDLFEQWQAAEAMCERISENACQAYEGFIEKRREFKP